jgi:competence ComEA-like helix-hairpin-helix protein
MDPRVMYDMMSNSKRYVLDLPIDVNTATVAELMLVPGIGKYTARQIVQYRDRCGAFKRLGELRSIPDLGEKKFNIIERHFCVGGGHIE